jgi:DNA-binding beta-propeller fold protein YncE
MDRRQFVSLGVAGVPAVLGLRLPPNPRAGREPLALVTADQQAHVVVVALAGAAVRARIPTLPGPRSVESTHGGRALVAHTTEGAVSVLGGRPVRVTHVVHGFSAPRYTAMAPDGRHAYVSDSGAGEVVVVDLWHGRIRARAHVGLHARHLTLDPAGRTLWVALGPKAPAIAVVDVSDPWHPRLRDHVHPPFLAHDVGFAPGGRRVWVTSGDRRRIAVFAVSGARPGPRILVADAPPQHVTFGNGVAYVASGDSRTLRVHALAGGRPLHTATVPAGSYNVQSGGGRVLTPSLERGTLTVLDDAGRVLAGRRVALAAHDACVIR